VYRYLPERERERGLRDSRQRTDISLRERERKERQQSVYRYLPERERERQRDRERVD